MAFYKTLDQYITTMEVSKESMYRLRRYGSLITTSNSDLVHDLTLRSLSKMGWYSVKAETNI